jgi:hypothetical protein
MYEIYVSHRSPLCAPHRWVFTPVLCRFWNFKHIYTSVSVRPSYTHSVINVITHLVRLSLHSSLLSGSPVTPKRIRDIIILFFYLNQFLNKYLLCMNLYVCIRKKKRFSKLHVCCTQPFVMYGFSCTNFNDKLPMKTVRNFTSSNFIYYFTW